MPQLLTFTPNPALDVATTVAQMLESHKIRCAAPQLHPGGGGVNVARVLHRLGSAVRALYPAGGPNGERLHQLLQAEGVPDLPLPVVGETRQSFTVHERSTGREYRFVLPGPELSAEEWQSALDRLRTELGRAPAPATLVCSGSLPPGVPSQGYAQVARLAQEMGVRLALDTSGPALQAALAVGVWLLKPSLRELSDCVGRPLTTRIAQRQAAEQLLARGQAQMVALSLGSEGAMLVTPTVCLHASALPVQVRSSVGAGDSFLAGLLCALERGDAPATALAWASAAGAAAVACAGTAMAEAGEIARLREQVELTALA